MKPFKHTVETLFEAVKSKGLDSFLSVVRLDSENSVVVLKDKEYGEYNAVLKNFCPGQSVPLHKTRKHLSKMQAHKLKYLGKDIRGMKVLDVFYGPDRGYKNRSFYIEYVGTCGHVSINTRAAIINHKKTFECSTCAFIVHGDRAKEAGVRKPRTATYTHWMRARKNLPPEYHDFSRFKAVAGDKPYKKAEVRMLDGKPVWIDLQVADECEVNLISAAVRQAFRHSSIYKEAVKAASVETQEGTRYICAACKQLTLRSKIQVDHIDPIKKLDGSALTKEEIIPRVWTNKIEILDKVCHSKKTLAENKVRNSFKRENKKGKR